MMTDPTRVKDKEAANEKIKQFSEWLNSFKREDYRQLSVESLCRLREIATDSSKMLEGQPQTTGETKNA